MSETNKSVEPVEVIVMHSDGWTELNATDWMVTDDETLSVRVSVREGLHANALFARGYWQSIVPVSEEADK